VSTGLFLPSTDAEREGAAAHADHLRREIAAHSSVAPLVTPTVLGTLFGLFAAVLVAGLMQRAGLPEPVWKMILLLIATSGALLGLRAAERARRRALASLLSALEERERTVRKPASGVQTR
jgi:hypothetical protein